jgi:ubiquinone/menaquinone biosynthesis C-methylase UbiE
MANNSKHFWNETWQREDDRYYLHFQFILEKLPEKRKVIDVGCGTGTLLGLIKQNKPGLKIEGRDISNIAIMKLKGRGINGKVEKLPNISGKADIIIATEVLEHMKDDEKVLQSMSKVAKQIIITVPNDRLGPEECDEHERKYTAKSLAEVIGKYFKKYEIYDANKYLLAIARN